MPNTARDDLILRLLGSGDSTDGLYELLRIGALPDNNLTGFFDAGSTGDMEAILRDMERRGLVERHGFEWR